MNDMLKGVDFFVLVRGIVRWVKGELNFFSIVFSAQGSQQKGLMDGGPLRKASSQRSVEFSFY